MKKKLITICAVLSVILLSTSVATAMTTVDPDPAHSAGDDISTAFWGVTLSSDGDGEGAWPTPDGKIYATDPKAISLPAGQSFNPSTPDLVFGHNGNFPNIFWGQGKLHFRADFTSALATEVSLDFIGPRENAKFTGELYAYDAGGTYLTSKVTDPLGHNVVETLTVSDAGGIAYILAHGLETHPGVSWDIIGIDNMQWEAIPAPGAILLGSLGVGLVGWLRRRRTL